MTEWNADQLAAKDQFLQVILNIYPAIGPNNNNSTTMPWTEGKNNNNNKSNVLT